MFMYGFMFGIAFVVVILAVVVVRDRNERLREWRERQVDEWDDYLRDCDFRPDECRDVHLPGDCPLCGGE